MAAVAWPLFSRLVKERFVYEITNQPASSRLAELGWAVWMTVLGGVVRFVNLDGTGLSHFDEGVYVLWGAGSGYPFKEFFAPPLYPLLVRAFFEILGPSDLAAQGVSALVGTATVPLVWCVARRWYGPVAAAITVAIAAFSGIHVAFSRMALTDASFCFLFVLAIWLVSEVFARCRRPNLAHANTPLVSSGSVWPLAILAGIATGAAMNTKYNGVLVLVFAAAFLCLFAIVSWRGELSWRLAIAGLIAAGATAIASYLPWFVHVQSRFGYARLLEHHRGYGTGLASWPANLVTLLAEQRSFDRGLGWIGVALGVAFAICLSGQPLFRVRGLLIPGMAAAGLGLELGDGAGWLFGPIVVAWLARSRQPHVLLHFVWLSGLFVLTPLYRPYARLLLPLVSAGWLAAGGLIASCVETSARTVAPQPFRIIPVVILGVVAAIASLDRTRSLSARSACELLVDAVPANTSFATLARPPVVFYVGSRRQLSLLDPDAGLDSFLLSASGPSRLLLVDLALVRDNPKLRAALDAAGDRLRERARSKYQPSRAVLLDDFGRQALRDGIESRVDETYQLVLFELIADGP